MRPPDDFRVGDTVQYKEREIDVSHLTGEVKKLFKTKPGFCKVKWEDGLTRNEEFREIERVDTV